MIFFDMSSHVALFGFYKYRNFGDDLMAVMFGKELQRRGTPFKVFCLHPRICSTYGFEAALTIDELLEGAALVVYGGGGTFLTYLQRQILSDIIDFERDQRAMLDVCAKKNIPIHMLSVGGSGGSYDALSETQRSVLSHASSITFRNREDDVLASRRKEGSSAVYDDVVWRTPLYFPLKREKRKGDRIVVGFSANRRQTKMFVVLIRILSLLFFKQCTFVDIKQGYQHSSSVPRGISYDVDIERFIAEILSLDLVVADKLHVGVVAMTFDIPVVLLFPVAKARLLFRRLKLDDLVFSWTTLFRFFQLLWSPRVLSAIRPRRRIDQYDEIVANSGMHVQALHSILDASGFAQRENSPAKGNS